MRCKYLVEFTYISMILIMGHAIKIKEPGCETFPDHVQNRLKAVKNMTEAHTGCCTPLFDTVKPTVVVVWFLVRGLYDLDELKEQFVFNTGFGCYWNDPRLKSKHKVVFELSSANVERIWNPGLVFTNEVDGKMLKVPSPQTMGHIHNNGDVILYKKLYLDVTCKLNLRLFPFDTQICEILIKSQRHGQDLVILSWRKRAVVLLLDRPLPEYTLDSYQAVTGFVVQTLGKLNHSCLSIKLKFTRQPGFYIIQFYIPSFIIVVVSWLSFWFGVDAVPGRIFMGIMLVLTLTTQNMKSRSDQAPVSYLKALDTWLGMCQLFLFASIIEFVCVNVTARSETWFALNLRVKALIMLETGRQKSAKSNVPDDTIEELIRHVQEDKKCMMSDSQKAQLIDQFARICFPAAFFVFNIIYWITYLYILHDVTNNKESTCVGVTGKWMPLKMEGTVPTMFDTENSEFFHLDNN